MCRRGDRVVTEMTPGVVASSRNVDRSDLFHHVWFHHRGVRLVPDEGPENFGQGTHDPVEAADLVGLKSVKQLFKVRVMGVTICSYLAAPSYFDVF